MSSPLIGSKVFASNPEAEQFHTVGLQAELSGEYAEAHELFDRAQQVLADVPQTMDTIVQSARIVRDDGFTYVRAAIAESNPASLDQAQATIRRSVAATAPLISGMAYAPTQLPQAHETPKAARKELLAEHGATVSLLGRAATVKAVMLGVDTRGDSDVAHHARTVEQQPYGLAHDMLRRGNNGYYRVSNAMVGARQERLNGRLPHMGVWLGRAAAGLAWTALRDPGNLTAAVRTVGGRMPHLRSYQAAVASVTRKP